MKFGIFFRIFVAACLMIGFVACTDDNEEPVLNVDQEEEATLECSFDKVIFDANGGKEAFSFTASKDWEIKLLGNITWCTVSSSKGSAGTQSVDISVVENETSIERNATLMIVSGDKSHFIFVTQKQRDAFILSNERVEIESTGGQIEIGVKTNVDYEMHIVGDAARWIKEKKSRALVSYSHVFSIDANENMNSRNGEIRFETSENVYIVKVYQEGLASNPLLVLSQKEYVVGASGETIIVEVKSNVDFGVKMPEVDWIKAITDSRSLSTHTLRYIVESNETFDERIAEIVFYDKNSILRDTVSIVQLQKDGFFLMKDEIEVEQEGGKFVVDINANVKYNIEIPSDAKDWLDIVESRSLSNYSHEVIVAANITYSERVAEVAFTDQNGSVYDVLVIKQKQKDLLQVSKKRYDLSAKKNTIAVEVEANVDFSIQIGVDWMTLIEKKIVSSTKQNLYFAVDDNLTMQDRNGQIVIFNKEKEMQQIIDVFQKKEEQESSGDKEPEGSVGDMNWD